MAALFQVLTYHSWSSPYVGFDVLTAVVMKSTIFLDITPCSPLKVNRRFAGTYRLHLQGRGISRERNQHERRWQAEPASTLISCSAYSSTLKMEAICSSETSVDFQQTTRRYFPKDSTLHLPHTSQCHVTFTVETASLSNRIIFLSN
jgi:hypothetical protein